MPVSTRCGAPLPTIASIRRGRANDRRRGASPKTNGVVAALFIDVPAITAANASTTAGTTNPSSAPTRTTRTRCRTSCEPLRRYATTTFKQKNIATAARYSMFVVRIREYQIGE